jgi:tetratricopeptide (TPR) repeat protein
MEYGGDVEPQASPSARVTMVDALRAHKRAVDAGALDRARAMAWRLLAAGAIDVSVLAHMAEHLFGAEDIAAANRFARIAAVIEPARSLPYLVVLRVSEMTSKARAYRLGGWVFVCDPSNAEAPGRAATLARLEGDNKAALTHFQRDLGLRPWSAAVWVKVGAILRDLEDDEASLRALKRAACLSPGIAAAAFAIAGAMAAVFDQQGAAERYGQVLIIDPSHQVAHQNRAHALRRQGRLPLAIISYRRSLLLDPGQPNVLVALGQLVLLDRDIETVHALLSRARVVGPDHAQAQFFGALTDLRTGRFEAGWEGYFWFRKLDLPQRARRQRLPRWPEEESNPSGLLVWNDQIGIGEEVMYLGAIGQLAERVDRLTISCTPKLQALVKRSFPHVEVTSPELVETNDPELGDRPSEIPLIAIMPTLRRRFEDFSDHKGYLIADPARVAALRERYRGPDEKQLIGISWSSPLGFQGSRKSVPLAEWGPVFRALDARFISLQYHADPVEIAEARDLHGVEIVVDPDLEIFEDLDAQAAQIAAMDRVISISSIAAHVAGALGKPVDMLYPSEIALLWYWFDGRSDSPWYPSMTIHRPPHDGDRHALMTALAGHLGQKT